MGFYIFLRYLKNPVEEFLKIHARGLKILTLTFSMTSDVEFLKHKIL